jgi:hypothetical protein
MKRHIRMLLRLRLERARLPPCTEGTTAFVYKLPLVLRVDGVLTCSYSHSTEGALCCCDQDRFAVDSDIQARGES